MEKKLLLPKEAIDIETLLTDGVRLYFLAGPIRGGNDWQAAAIKKLWELDPRCYIVCPCRYDSDHDLHQYKMHREDIESKTRLAFIEFEFLNQTTWERFYLELAAQYGSIIFWLPCEDKHNPRKKEGGPYARDTYGELGRWSTNSANHHRKVFFEKRPPLNLTVGAEKEFPGLSVIQKNFNADHLVPFRFYETLEDTLRAAVKRGKETNPQPLFNSDNC